MQSDPVRKTKYRVTPEERVLSVATLLAALLLTRLRIHGVHAPFAVALLYAAALSNVGCLWTAAGVLVGCLLGEPSWHGAATAALFSCSIALIRVWRERLSEQLKTAVLLLSALVSLPLCAVYGPREFLYALFLIPVTVAAGLCMAKAIGTLRTIRSTKLITEWEQNALLVVWGLCILACSELTAGEVSVSVILILFTTMVLTRTRGLYGSFVASLLSAAWVLYAKADARIVALVTLGAALSIPFCNEGRLWIAAGHFAATLLLVGMQPEGLSPAIIWNTAAASVLLLLLPQPMIRRLISLTAIDRTIRKNERASLRQAQKRTAASLDRMEALLKEVSDTFEPKGDEPAVCEEWIVQGALVICRTCEHQSACWSRADDMRVTVTELAERLDNAEKVIPLDPIRPDCGSFSDLCASILLAYQQTMMRSAMLGRLRNQSRFTARELFGAGDAMGRLAESYRLSLVSDREAEDAILKRLLQSGYAVESVEVLQDGASKLIRVHISETESDSLANSGKLRTAIRCVSEAIDRRVRLIRTEMQEDGEQLLLEPAPRWNVRMAVSQATPEETESGDSYGEWNIRGGKTLFALSDGMGNGTRAAQESQSAIGALFRLYDSGMERELICDNMNRLLMHRSADESYATIDAVSFDLNTGTAELLKFGTPPSYLLRGNTLYALCGEALPCGIVDDAKPTVIRIGFEPNDVLLLLTDGVTDALQERLESVLTEHGGRRDAAKRILAAARETGYRDDQSVMVLQVRR